MSLASGLRPISAMYICSADIPSWLFWTLVIVNTWFVFSPLGYWIKIRIKISPEKALNMESHQQTFTGWPHSTSINRPTTPAFPAPSGLSFNRQDAQGTQYFYRHLRSVNSKKKKSFKHTPGKCGSNWEHILQSINMNSFRWNKLSSTPLSETTN